MNGGGEVNPAYQIATPMFSLVRVRLQSGTDQAKELLITASPDPEKNPYIQSATLNGKPLRQLTLTQEQIAAGAQLDLVLSSQPNPGWRAP